MAAQWKPKPWIAILLGVVLQFLVFLYINRPRLFWVYFAAKLAVIVGCRWAFLDVDTDYRSDLLIMSLPFVVACPLHAYLITRDFEPGGRRGWYSRWWAIPSIVAAVVLVRVFLYEPYNVPSSAMSPNLNIGSYFVVQKWGFPGYGSLGRSIISAEIPVPSKITRGEIYVFYPPDMDVSYVKKVIGLPGDKVEFEGETIIVNGQPLTTEFVSDSKGYQVFRETMDGHAYLIQKLPRGDPFGDNTFQIPKEHYFVVGDNRNESIDSRYFGAVPRSRFVGEVVLVFGGKDASR